MSTTSRACRGLPRRTQWSASTTGSPTAQSTGSTSSAGSAICPSFVTTISARTWSARRPGVPHRGILVLDHRELAVMNGPGYERALSSVLSPCRAYFHDARCGVRCEQELGPPQCSPPVAIFSVRRSWRGDSGRCGGERIATGSSQHSTRFPRSWRGSMSTGRLLSAYPGALLLLAQEQCAGCSSSANRTKSRCLHTAPRPSTTAPAHGGARPKTSAASVHPAQPDQQGRRHTLGRDPSGDRQPGT